MEEKKKNLEQVLNTKTCRPKMAPRSAEEMRRWQPRGLEHAGLFLISINPAWLLSFPAKRAKEKEKKNRPPKLTLPYESQGIETGKSNFLFCPPTYTYSLKCK